MLNRIQKIRNCNTMIAFQYDRISSSFHCQSHCTHFLTLTTPDVLYSLLQKALMSASDCNVSVEKDPARV